MIQRVQRCLRLWFGCRLGRYNISIRARREEICPQLTVDTSSSVFCQQMTLAFEARAESQLLFTCKLPHYSLTDGLGSPSDDADEAIKLAVRSVRRKRGIRVINRVRHSMGVACIEDGEVLER